MEDERNFASDPAFAALVRNALAFEDKPLRIVRPRTFSRCDAPVEVVSDDSREQYEYEFRELMFKRLDAGMMENCGAKLVMPECCAHHATLSELGCLEVWELMNSQPVQPRRVRSVPARQTASTFCSRCEAIGHELTVCPFPDDEETRRIAVLRRERRRGQKERAA